MSKDDDDKQRSNNRRTAELVHIANAGTLDTFMGNKALGVSGPSGGGGAQSNTDAIAAANATVRRTAELAWLATHGNLNNFKSP